MSAAQPLRVLVRRGATVESVHSVAWSLGDGAVGIDPRAPVYVRSAAKPLQALVAVRAGVLERFGLDQRHLALAAASHGGSDEHIEIVREVLAAAGLEEDHLGCGPSEALDPVVADALHARGESRLKIRHNCSGKHAMALATCVASDWPLEGYLDDDHPLQREMRAAVRDAAQVGEAEMREAVDGCGMRTFALPLPALARTFGQLASGGLGEAGTRIADAMRAHPRLVAFPGAIDAELMSAHDGLIAKIGAEGVLAIGLPDGRGLALKVRDGATRALAPAGVGAVRRLLGLEIDAPALDRLAVPRIVNSRGEPVGGLELS